MTVCDERPGHHPLNRTLCGDQRSCDPARQPGPRSAEAAGRCRADLPGGRSGAVGRPVGASLAGDVLRNWLGMCYGRLGQLFLYLVMPGTPRRCARVSSCQRTRAWLGR